MNANILTIDDLTDFEGEARILDIRLAEALGFERSRDIRKLIDRNSEELEEYGELRATVARGGNQQATEYHLNMEQALTVSVLSNAKKAPFVRQMLIRVFMSWMRGELTPPPQIQPLPVDRRQALAEVREARLIFGTRAARAIWSQSPDLPRVPEMAFVAASGGEAGTECVRHVLAHVTDEGETVRELILAAFEAKAHPALRALGIYIDVEAFQHRAYRRRSCNRPLWHRSENLRLRQIGLL